MFLVKHGIVQVHYLPYAPELASCNLFPKLKIHSKINIKQSALLKMFFSEIKIMNFFMIFSYDISPGGWKIQKIQ